MKYKRAFIVTIAAIAYFCVLPLSYTWLEFDTEVYLPGSWSYDEDMPLEFTLSSWHSNYQIALVRFYPDFYDSDLRGEPKPMHPQPLIHEKRRRHWSALSLNRITWPRRERHELVVPLTELAKAGRSAPGILRGYVEITIMHATLVGTPDGSSSDISARRITERISFEIRLY